jgi:hypothetical protein
MNSAEIENPSLPTGDESPRSSADEDFASVDQESASGEKHPAETLYRHASARAAAAANETSGAIDRAASTLADSGHEKFIQAADALAEQLRKVSSYFENRGLEDVIGDARRVVQRNPALFIAGGVAVGFALSRLLTSVERSRAERRSS